MALFNVFFWAKFHHLATKKKRRGGGGFGNCFCQIHHILRKILLESPYLDIAFKEVPIQNQKNKLQPT